MATNYLPFAKRSVLTLAAGARGATSISDLSVGGGVRAHLGDLAICYDGLATVAPNGTEDFVTVARLGIVGRGYLTESFYVPNLFKDGVYPENGVWHFPKPYRLYPGQRMRALTRIPNPGAGATPMDLTQYGFFPAISFNGRRVSDDQPIMLYDRSLVVGALGGNYVLNGETLQCPADSPVDLYSVIFNPDYDRYTRYIWMQAPRGCVTWNMIYGPDDRQWWDQLAWPQVVNPPTTLIDLNRPEWVMGPQEGLTVEYWNNNVQAVTIITTLRGSLEVEG